MASWIERYLNGQHRQVWTEVTGLGAGIFDDDDAMRQAEQVGRETMRRARRNIDVLVERLIEVGYVFSPGGQARSSPPDDVSDQLSEVEHNVGRLPLSFVWWSEDVGGVNLTGSHDDVPLLADPLVVEAPVAFLASEADDWLASKGTEWERSRFEFGFSPDYLHKANISGGAPYSLRTPADGADGLVLWERHNTTFVNLLRIAFSEGGFLGWSSGACAQPRPDWLGAIARDMQPL